MQEAIRSFRNSCFRLAAVALGVLWYEVAGASPVDSTGGRMVTLDGVKVTATRLDPTLSAPAPRQQYDSEELKRRGAVDMGDALNRFSGITVKDYGGAGGMKTVSVRGLGAQHTAVSYDGMIVSDAQTGQIDLGRFRLSAITELGLTVGDDFGLLQPARTAAAAATVNISTFRPFGTKASGIPSRRTLQLEQGSFDRYGVDGRIDQRVSERFAFSAIGSWMFSGNDYPFTLVNGLTETEEKRSNCRMTTWHGQWNGYWDVGRNSLLDAKLYYYDNNHHLPGVVVYYNPYSNEKLHDRNAFAQMRWLKSLNSNWTLQVMGKYNWQESKYTNRSDIYPDGILLQNYWQREAYASALVAYEDRQWGVSYAADYFYDDLNSNQKVFSDVARHSILQSLTANLSWGPVRLSGRLLGSIFRNHVSAGETALNAERLTPSLGLSYRPFKQEVFFLRAFYKDIFRMPTFTENYYYHLGSTDILPERTHQLGAGITFNRRMAAWWPGLKITVDGYVNRIKDKITSVPINLHVWRTVNLGEVHAKGVDINLESRFRPAQKHMVTLSGNYTLQHVVDKTFPGGQTYNKQLPYLPRYSGCLSLAYENPWVNFSASGQGASCRYSTQEHAHGTQFKGYTLINLSLWKPFSLHTLRMEARADLQNVFDKQYSLIAGYPMPGRAYRLTLSIQF